MPEVNAPIAASREVTCAYNALYWGRWLSDELQHEASARLGRALEAVVSAARDEAQAHPSGVAPADEGEAVIDA
jgi:hypothetical protein